MNVYMSEIKGIGKVPANSILLFNIDGKQVKGLKQASDELHINYYRLEKLLNATGTGKAEYKGKTIEFAGFTPRRPYRGNKFNHATACKCLNTGKVYPSKRAVMEEFGMKLFTLNKILDGRREDFNGFRFEEA